MNSLFTCEICGDRMEDDEDETLKCGHIVHGRCIRQYLEHETKSSKKLQIACLKCSKENKANPYIDDADIGRLAPWLSKNRQTIVHSGIVIDDPDKFKYCMTPNCKGIAEVFDGNQIKCALCKVWQCIDCQCPIEVGHICDEHQKTEKEKERDINDEALETYYEDKRKKGEAQKCPGCKIWVERTEACPHMTCACKTQFCYKCGALYPGPHKICPCGMVF